MEKVNPRVYTRLSDTKTLVKISILSAIAFVIFLVEFPLPYFPPFLEVDFSDVIAVIGGVMLGPVAGIFIQLIKNILRLLLINSGTGGIGELANFLVGIAYVIPISLLYVKKKTNIRLLISMVTGILSMVVVAGLANYFILIPVYTGINAHADKLSMILTLYGPFNIIKGIIISIVGFIVIPNLKKVKFL